MGGDSGGEEEGLSEESRALLHTGDDSWNPDLADGETQGYACSSDLDGDAHLAQRRRFFGWFLPLGVGAFALCTALGNVSSGSRSSDSNSLSSATRGGHKKIRSDALVNELGADCHTAQPGEKCWEDMLWAKNHGIFDKPKLFPHMTNRSYLGDFQMALHQNDPDSDCPEPCRGGNTSDEKPCDPPLVKDDFGICNKVKESAMMTFYMYRAQDDSDYAVENVNLASLPGVMWYLHNEVVGSRPRKYHITRLIRYKITMKNTPEHWNAEKKQFGPFVAFDKGSATGRTETWEKFGFVVGCQLVPATSLAYIPPIEEQPECSPEGSPLCTSGKWYSLPGPCPEEKVGEKSPDCVANWPGGMCPSAVVTGEPHCTYWAEYAGQIMLDELEGIPDYNSWWLTKNSKGGIIPNDNVEYDRHLDRGIGMDFWDYGADPGACANRMNRVKALFKEKFPQYPDCLPEPPCN